MGDDQTPADSGRSPWVWGGALVIVVALGLNGLTRIFPFDPDGWLGRWYVQAAVVALGVGAFAGGAWLIGRGRRKRMEIDVPE